jgi:LPS sulfotransferase NodH
VRRPKAGFEARLVNGIRKVRPTLSYLICCAERTGSTLLGDALIDTGIAGRPRSYFNRVAHYNPKMQRVLGNAKDDDSYLGKVVAAATTPNGVFGAKVHWEHFLNLIAKAERSPQGQGGATPASVPERLRAHFPDLRYIWLVRRNAVARAISHYRVKKTNRWQLDSRWITDDTGGEGEPGFDFDGIDAFVRIGEVEDAHWRKFFQEHDISPLELIYEELVRDLEGTVRLVLGFLGIPAENIKVRPPTLRKQADDHSREWEARYRKMCTDEGA